MIDMKLRDIGEFGLIDQIDNMITRGQRSLPSRLKIGIGDDAAVWQSSANTLTVATVDTLVEGTHFTRTFTSWKDIGWKAMAVNLSDIAAMGARPRWALVSLTVPDNLALADVRALYQGLITCGRRFDTRIVGGNIARDSKVTVSVTLIGGVKPGRLLKRDGARVRDIIAVTGDLGAAAAGLTALKRGVASPQAIRRYRRPVPRLDWLTRLQKAGITLHSAIDLSDGLGSDLRHLCAASKTGARIDLDCIPVASSTLSLARKFRKRVEEWTVNGGEDYELLLSMNEREFKKAKKTLGRQLTKIGMMTASRGVEFYSGERRVRLKTYGFRHF